MSELTIMFVDQMKMDISEDVKCNVKQEMMVQKSIQPVNDKVFAVPKHLLITLAEVLLIPLIFFLH